MDVESSMEGDYLDQADYLDQVLIEFPSWN